MGPRGIFPKLRCFTAARLLTHPAQQGRSLTMGLLALQGGCLSSPCASVNSEVHGYDGCDTENLECTSDSRSLGVSMYHREEMILH